VSLLSKPELVKLAVEVANEFGLDPALICAHIDVRTRWDSGFILPMAISYLVHQSFPDPMESEHRAIQWGLMAIQGEFARGLEYTESLAQLIDPLVNLTVGCRFFRRLMCSSDPSLAVVEALMGWNREIGKEFAAQTLGKLEAYRELLARIDEAPRTFLCDDNSHLPEYSQIEGNPLLEVGSTTHTRSQP
jgi:soluble lytic murein transglycosylase-like protein